MKKTVASIIFIALLLSVVSCTRVRDKYNVSGSLSRQADEQEEVSPSPALEDDEIPEEAPEASPDEEDTGELPEDVETPEISPDTAPENSPENSPEEPPEISPEISPEESPEEIQPPEIGGRAAYAQLSENEAVVYDYDDLYDALFYNNGITNVYFGADIALDGGVLINSHKSHVVISGLNPLEPEKTEPYRLTDTGNSAIAGVIYINSSDVSTVTVRDLNITGKNFFGPVSVVDSSQLLNVILIFERVDYNGPQIGYHRNGAVYFRDCSVRIHGGNGGSVMQEFSEVKHLIFEGTNSIHSESSAWSVFWHPFGGSFTVADDSSVTVVVPNSSGAYGTFYADGAANRISIQIGERATFDLTISGAFALAGVSTISGITVREAGAFRLTTTKAAIVDTLRCGGAIIVEKDAEFIVSGYGGSAVALLRQAGGDITVRRDAVFRLTADNAYSPLLNLAGQSFVCDDAASVLFYNGGRNIQAASASGLSIDAQQVNYWTALNGGGLDNPPLRSWYKPYGGNFTLSGTIGINGSFSSISSNYVPGDPPGSAPDNSTFNMVSARVLSFGRLALTVIEPTVNSTVINGVTKPYAAVRATYSVSGSETVLPDVVADKNGIFHIPLETALAAGTVITVKSSLNYLYATVGATVTTEGALEFFVPDTLEFFVTDIPSAVTTVKRLNSNWSVVVSDDRGAGSGWSVYMRLDREMTPDKPGLPVLADSLIYIDDDNNKTALKVGEEHFIMRRTAAENDELTNISWDENHGILLSVQPGAAFTGTAYSATISWILVDGP